MNGNKHCYHSTHWFYHEVMLRRLLSKATLSMNTRIANVHTVLQFLARALCKQSFVSTELPSIPLHAVCSRTHILCRCTHAHKTQTYICLEMHIILSVYMWFYLVFQSFPTLSLFIFPKPNFLSEVPVIESLWACARLQSVQPRSICQYLT